jgi:hypothetical protein
MSEVQKKQLLRKIRIMMIFFMASVFVSGVTAFDTPTGLHYLLQHKKYIPDALIPFMEKTLEGLNVVHSDYPMIEYGFDWLAFAHIVIAIMFVGPYRDPVKNQWVIQWAMIACISIIPLAITAGPIREIPLYWKLIDCSFGVFGIIPLLITNNWIKKLKGIPVS